MFGRGAHWTARASEHGTDTEAVDLRGYRAERRRALHLVNALLASSALRAEDWDGEAYQVIAYSGAAVKAGHLADIWTVVGRMGAAQVDPLAEDFLAARS